MKFLQLIISFFSISCGDLCYHQMENHYDTIFLQETNYDNSISLGNFKNGKVNTHTIFKNKTLGYGVGTFLPNTTRNVFTQDLINQDLEIVWTALEINAKKSL